MNRESLITLAAIAWLAFCVWALLTQPRSAYFDMDGRCHGCHEANEFE